MHTGNFYFPCVADLQQMLLPLIAIKWVVRAESLTDNLL